MLDMNRSLLTSCASISSAAARISLFGSAPVTLREGHEVLYSSRICRERMPVPEEGREEM